MAEDMIERAVKALEECCETDDAWHRRDLDDVPMPELARAALLAALDPEDEALVQAVGIAIGSTDFIAREAIKAIAKHAQGERSSQEQVREKD